MAYTPKNIYIIFFFFFPDLLAGVSGIKSIFIFFCTFKSNYWEMVLKGDKFSFFGEWVYPQEEIPSTLPYFSVYQFEIDWVEYLSQ